MGTLEIIPQRYPYNFIAKQFCLMSEQTNDSTYMLHITYIYRTK